MIDVAAGSSASSVAPAGVNLILENLETYTSSGTPVCKPSENAVPNASVSPASVEPCLSIRSATSSTVPSGAAVTVR
jgi:hypothetical protein